MLFALCGFAVAEPLFELLRQTPLFLVARQNTVTDVWLLAAFLTFILPLLIALPALILANRLPVFSRGYVWVLASVLCGFLFAQLIRHSLEVSTGVFLVGSLVAAVPVAWLLLFTRWNLLAAVLAVITLSFPVRLLFFSPIVAEIRGLPDSSFVLEELDHSPDIVFVVFDELPVTTLLDNDGQIDGRLFPGFKRLQNTSNWYFDAISIADSTTYSVPAILTGRFPNDKVSKPTVAEQPVNLFTLLRNRYDFNVVEPVTRLCPRDECMMTGPGGASRFWALLLDLSAIYLHRVFPAAWEIYLPDVENNWSGFFADRQVFFPQGWAEHMGTVAKVDRAGLFNGFIDSVKRSAERPVLNFLHVLLPHEPWAYLPDGENYGVAWMRGRVGERWEDHEWGIVSAKQRHYLQTQFVDRLLGQLLDRLESEGMLDSSLVVVLADHGASFQPGDQKRVLTDENAANMLRVPLFIKFPGQRQGRRLTYPVMTVDILPTILSRLGVDVSVMNLDGVDLETQAVSPDRPRFAHSQAAGQLKMRPIDEAYLEIARLTAINREQLRLDDAELALWGVGPYGYARGEDLSSICTPQTVSIRYYPTSSKPLPHTEADKAVPAFVAGSIGGDDAPLVATPFVISSQGVISASGTTWILDGAWQYFALVEPVLVKRADWSPEIALIAGDRCLLEP